MHVPELIWTVPADIDGKLVRQAAMGGMGLSYGLFKRAKFHGLIELDGQTVRADEKVHAGQRLRIVIPEKENTLPEKISLPLKVAYEDEHLLMVDKPAPLPSASSPRKEQPTLENAVFVYLGCPGDFVYRPVNRLDKGTSGLMMVAKTAYGQHLMQKLLHTDFFIREYLAVTEGTLPETEGVIDLPIAKVEGATVKRTVSPEGKVARTHFRVLEESRGRSIIRLRLETGRTHQIRVHLSASGCPICGDFLYGTELAQLQGRFALHSTLCRFRHPVSGQWVERESPLPEELLALVK
ncbi:MAG: RluA family pseudouridine synthase [Clostridiales bacterium]|nr:RluA family pseudouridine synthase [Clostridiales bacterium]